MWGVRTRVRARIHARGRLRMSIRARTNLERPRDAAEAQDPEGRGRATLAEILEGVLDGR